MFQMLLHVCVFYERFFKGAFPETVEELGIVYTPVECVDFIIHSVNDLLQQEFHTSLTEKDVHILAPFTGTGTFVTRLLQSGFIKKEDLKRKYQNEIYCNEIVLLAYYIANVNIESVYHAIAGANEYLHYDNIILTDTFNITEDKESLSYEELQENNERILRQQKAPSTKHLMKVWKKLMWQTQKPRTKIRFTIPIFRRSDGQATDLQKQKRAA